MDDGREQNMMPHSADKRSNQSRAAEGAEGTGRGGGAPRQLNDDPLRIPIEPEIDLHTFLPRDITSVVEAYVTEAHAAGLREVRLIHGRGRGVQRGIVQQALERHPLVLQFFDDPASHLGATIAILNAAHAHS
jgi:DNA-nicking Smr family endonuclease